jgi:hypothetical protein
MWTGGSVAPPPPGDEMAQYHFHANIIKRSQGHSAVASAAYRSGEKIRDERIGDTFDYRRRRGILYTDIMAPDNVLSWMLNRAQLWNGVEKIEKRTDSQLARSVDISLMSELSLDKNIELLRAFVKEQWVDRGMIADIAIHEPGPDGDARNIHAHIMLTMREIDEDGFGQKQRDWNDKNELMQWREAWAKHANHMLEREGFEERIDHRSLIDQGIGREPTIHVGPAGKGMEKKHQVSERAEQNRELKHINDELERLQADLKKAEDRLAELQRLQATGDTAGPSHDAEKALPHEPLQPPSGLGYPPGQQPPPTTGGEGDSVPDDLTKDQALKDEQDRQKREQDAQKTREDQAAKDQADTLKKNVDDEKTRKEQAEKAEIDRQQKLADYNKHVERLAWENAQRAAAQAEEMRREYARQLQTNRKAEFDKQNLETAHHAQQVKQELKNAASRAIAQEQGQGHFREAGMRYGAALAEHYDMANPYGSLAKAAMSEYAAFIKERESYSKRIAEENDPVKRQSLELRKRIEGADYLALTGERIAIQSELVTGRLNSEEAVKERAKVAYWQTQSKEARQELRGLEPAPAQTKERGATRPYRPRGSKTGKDVDEIIKTQDEIQQEKDKKDQERIKQQELERKRKRDRDRDR